MGRFYLPKNTLGVLNPARNGLLLYAGRASRIGFEGSKAELDTVEFEFSKDPVMEIYSAGAMRYEVLMPTSKPGSYTLSATNGAGKKLAPDIEVRVTTDRYIPSESPEGQMDVTACWMATTSWVSRTLQTRATLSQHDIMMKVAQGGAMWSNDGSIRMSTLSRLFAKEFASLKYKTERIKADQLYDYIDLYPLIVGYKETLMGHVNVITGHDGKGNLKIMDPWFPDPTKSGFRLEATSSAPYLFNPNPNASQSFQFTGALTTRTISYYTSRSLKPGNDLWLAYPSTIE